jgi:hypothetical protein
VNKPNGTVVAGGATLEELLKAHEAVMERLAAARFAATPGGPPGMLEIHQAKVESLTLLERKLALQANIEGDPWRN